MILPPSMEGRAEAYLARYVEHLGMFDEETLAAAAKEISLERTAMTLPPVDICARKCREIRARAIRASSRQKILTEVRKERKGEDCARAVLATGLARQAVSEGWITELYAWCLRKGYVPDDAEVKALKSDHAATERRWRETLESVASPAVRAAWRAIQARRENLAKAVGALTAGKPR